nr:aldolase/citrate lyase family protein [Pseudonocardia sp. C8]
MTTFAGLGSTAAIEVLGWAGFDTVCVDAEHSALDPSTIASMIRAADAVGAAVLVRVPDHGSDIGRVLDLGAAGVLVPRVESAEQARAVVSAVRYPPDGARGAGPGRAARYGTTMPEEVATANARVLCAVQVETVAGVEAVEEICAVEGLDVVMVGPGDLAVSMGAPPGSPAHDAAVEKILTAATAAGRSTGMFCLDPEQVERFARRGVRMLVMGSDAGLLGAAATQARDAAAAVLEAQVRS